MQWRLDSELSWVLHFIIRMEGVEEQDLNWLAETGNEGQVLFVNQASPDYQCFILYILIVQY